jgi:hypothetical protein
MTLPSGVFRYLMIAQTAIPIVFNVVIPLALGWLTYRKQPVIVTWAMDKGAVADFIGTCYLLPAVTCLIATPIVRRHVANGIVRRVPAANVPRWLLIFRGGLIWRAVKWGLATLTVLSMPVVITFVLLTGETIPTTRFLIVKVLFAVVLGCIVTPLISLVALTDEAHRS